MRPRGALNSCKTHHTPFQPYKGRTDGFSAVTAKKWSRLRPCASHTVISCFFTVAYQWIVATSCGVGQTMGLGVGVICVMLAFWRLIDCSVKGIRHACKAWWWQKPVATGT